MNPIRTLGADVALLGRFLAPLSIERRLCSLHLRRSPEGIDVFVFDCGAGPAGYRRIMKDAAAALSAYVYGFGETQLSESVARLFLAKKKSLALAESVTGGLIADRLTDLPGSSKFFMLSAVVYSNESKVRLLGVPAGVIERWGAVSRETCLAMVEGLSRLGTFHARVAVTGIAGPSGGTTSKPVGTVYVALQNDTSTVVKKLDLVGTRREIKEATVRAVMELLWRNLTTPSKRYFRARSREGQRAGRRYRSGMKPEGGTGGKKGKRGKRGKR